MVQHSTLPYQYALPHALGTGIIISTDIQLPDTVTQHISDCIDDIDITLSRFREDSLVSQLRNATYGTTITFPQWCEPLLQACDLYFKLTDGAIDPCVGEELGLLGYGPSIPPHHLQWDTAIQRLSPDMPTRVSSDKPVALDFGAFGKGLCIDRIAYILEQSYPNIAYCINAGGDLRINMQHHLPLHIALEHPFDSTQAIGTIPIHHGVLCASSPARRRWNYTLAGAQYMVHHLLDARTGQPSYHTCASWAAIVQQETEICTETTPPSGVQYLVKHYPAMIADACATALFTTSAQQLSTAIPAAMLQLDTNLRIQSQFHWFGTLFMQ